MAEPEQLIPMNVTAEEQAILIQYRRLVEYGYGKLEVVVTSHKFETCYHVRNMKRQDLLNDRQKWVVGQFGK